MISVRNLGRYLGRRWLFRHLEFELQAGDCLVITGRNGSGKSTLLRNLTGLDQPTEGTVTVDPARIGFSAIDQAIYPHLTAQEHVQLFLDLRGTGSADILKTVDLDYAQDTLASQLSSGMRARLKLALAIMHEPNVLILDEPSATLDASGIDRLGSAIQAQLKRGCAILATNDAADRQWATAELELGASTE